jgi:hypothetical protein
LVGVKSYIVFVFLSIYHDELTLTAPNRCEN